MSKNHYEYFSTTWRKCLNSVTVRIWDRSINKIFLRLYATLHTIQSMLVHRNASDCSKMSKKMIRSDFVTSSDEFFYAFHRFVDLQSSAFFWKLTVGQYFKSLANKSNSHESHFCIFFSMTLKKWKFWQTF